MSDDEIRIAIAEKCGFRKLPMTKRQCERLGCVKGTLAWFPPEDWKGEWTIDDIEPPDYPNDLNAMHEAWMTLDRKQRISFSKCLRTVIVYKGMSCYEEDIVALCENATARQRAEAFLRVFGLWREVDTGSSKK